MVLHQSLSLPAVRGVQRADCGGVISNASVRVLMRFWPKRNMAASITFSRMALYFKRNTFLSLTRVSCREDDRSTDAMAWLAVVRWYAKCESSNVWNLTIPSPAGRSKECWTAFTSSVTTLSFRCRFTVPSSPETVSTKDGSLERKPQNVVAGRMMTRMQL